LEKLPVLIRRKIYKRSRDPPNHRYTLRMSDELVVAAQAQAERSEATVRAPARLRIARVERLFERDAARRTFLRDLEAVQHFGGENGALFPRLARTISANVAVELITARACWDAPSDAYYSKTFLNSVLGFSGTFGRHGSGKPHPRSDQ
jgi:hypothetical protein